LRACAALFESPLHQRRLQSRDGGFHSALARYNSYGMLDASFGTGGKVTTNFGGESDEASSVVVQPAGKIIAAGQAFIGAGYDFALARYE
jgi:hypothetical protein